MRALYLEPFAGISGNMLLGALIHAGVPFAYLRNELAKLELGAYRLVHKQVTKKGILACYFNVLTDESLEVGDHDEERGDSVQEQAHALPEYCHSVKGEHKTEHVHVHDQVHVHRGLHDIAMILERSALNTEVIRQAKNVFLAIAEAEAKVHGTTVEEVHFHEIGAIDTIVDVVGNILSLQYLGVERIFTMPVNTGFGLVQCAHGLMPVPAPATAELLRGFPQYRGSIAEEMTTPTGAALLKVLAEPVEEVPPGFHGSVIGYGAGTRDVSFPNVLRITLGEYVAPASDRGPVWPEKEAVGGVVPVGVVVGVTDADNTGKAAAITDAEKADGSKNSRTVLTMLECNLDDMNPEFLPYVLDILLANGALDAWWQPIVMKKGRSGYLLSVLCEETQKVLLEQVLFTETTTLGVRAYRVSRAFLERRWRKVRTPWGSVRVKEGLLGGAVVNQAPEFEDCKQIAVRNHVPLKKVERAVWQGLKNKE